VGPLIVNGILDHYVANHLNKQDAYPLILHIMCGLLVVGLVADLLVRPVAAKYWLKGQAAAPVGPAMSSSEHEELAMAVPSGKRSSSALIAVAWVIVLVPAAWGLTYTAQNAMKIFSSNSSGTR
jgi:hypothetical protein